MPSALQILYEDNHCLAVSKPAPLLTQGVPFNGPAGEIPTLEHLVKSYLKDRYHKPGNVYLGIPHRLDRPVSGVVLFARNTKAARRLAEQFQSRQVSKTYWAVVHGTVEPVEGNWQNWIRKLPEQARSECLDSQEPDTKEASLHYRRVWAQDDSSYLEVSPKTGRMHQIRVQAAARGWPVLGDMLYGSSVPFGPETNDSRERIIALHARRLTFLHPIRFEPITLEAPLPETWGRHAAIWVEHAVE